MASPSIIGALRDREFWKDLARNTVGAGELGLSVGTGLVDMAGSGIGTLAGMAGNKLRGEDIDWDAAAETAPGGRATYVPRTEGGQRVAETVAAPMEWIDEKMKDAGGYVADVTGSPAAGAAAYTALNVADPQLLIPGVAKAAALRGASRVARSVTSPEVKATGFGGRQRGAWSPGDIADVEGDFELRSPLIDAFDRLKPQERGRVSGRQLLKALNREGVKADELRWSGLDQVLDTDEIINVADVQALAQRRAPKIIFDEAHGTRAGLLESRVEMAAEDMAMENAIANGKDWDTMPEHIRQMYLDDARTEIETDYEAYLGPEYNDLALENSFGEYTIGNSGDLAHLDRLAERMGKEDNAPPNYSIELARVQREGRYGRDRSVMLPDDQSAVTATQELERTARKLLPEGPLLNRELARIEALRADPWMQKAHKQALGEQVAPDSHFPENILHIRSSDRGIPEWGSPKAVEAARLHGVEEYPTRLIEEAQSDLYQGGRDSGYAVPEEIGPKLLENAMKRKAARAQIEPKIDSMLDTALAHPKINRTLQEIAGGQSMDTPPWMHQNIMMKMRNYEDVKNGTITDPDRIFEAKQQLMGSIKDLAAHSHAGTKWGAISNKLLKQYEDIQVDYDLLPARGEDQFYDRVPPGPMSDTKQYMPLALRRALANAVREGKQFVAFTPGDIHTTRYGAPAIAWKTNPDGTVTIRNAEINEEGYQRGIENAAQIIGAADPSKAGVRKALTFDPNDIEAVGNALDSLGRGASHDYVYITPEQLAERIRKNPSSVYAPRAQGNESAYNAMEKDLARILRESGSKAEIRDIEDYGLPVLLQRKTTALTSEKLGPMWKPVQEDRLESIGRYRGGNISREKYIDALRKTQAKLAEQGIETEIRPRTVRGIEIDPELARAVKRGLKLPY